MDVQKMLLHRAAKPLLFALSLVPLAWLVYAAVTDQLGANPAEALIRDLGDWTLRFLCLVLAVTPLRIATGTPALARFRRMLGLFVFFYGVLHLLAYAWFDMGLDVGEIVHDIAKRPFILVGTLALLLLAVLAATSPPLVGCGALAGTAQVGVRRSGAGDPAFLLDARGKKRLCRGAVVWRLVGRFARLAHTPWVAPAP